jgi:hypothetical protein
MLLDPIGSPLLKRYGSICIKVEKLYHTVNRLAIHLKSGGSDSFPSLRHGEATGGPCDEGRRGVGPRREEETPPSPKALFRNASMRF